MNTGEVLRYHAELYPLMRPTDAVKLLYQNEFGGGHLIENPRSSLAWLISEYASVAHDNDAPLTIPIGNGIIRVNLAALDIKKLSIERFNDIFVESSGKIYGNPDSFKEKLRLLVSLNKSGLFGFSPAELDDYLTGYAERGYPAVSHSAEFREAYHPAYRVVSEKLFPLPRA